ncbi:hypothetical protein [Agromyces sp. LHK192]|uniref:PDC sensor domain-containing protein n=1 Tax=Agromyces sp. LHK192 TaxID=2498704 RepID=UPI000FD98B2E|nr:hypothetical protein [Agromyces sp. LHK192]
MTVTVELGAAQVAARVASTIDPVFSMIDGWRDRLVDRLAADADPAAATLDPFVEALVGDALEEPGSLITGAGFVAAPGYLADAPWHLAWWLGAANTFGAGSGVRRLAAESDPDAEQFRDYTALEWWRVPARTGNRHLTGPYVDYLCTDDYTVTITTPVTIRGELVGVVGVDLYVVRVEQALLPVLRESARPCTLVNASGRITVSTDSRRATGAMLRIEGLAAALAPLREGEGRVDDATDASRPPALLVDGEIVVPCGDTSLALVLEA